MDQGRQSLEIVRRVMDPGRECRPAETWRLERRGWPTQRPRKTRRLKKLTIYEYEK